ncbi:MAG: flagellar basal-body rod protein FlgG [Gemmatimonadetes bacterium]|nr:flagellar basal-body rod protein FlgG [Gemmatimonadota bacterium]
MNPALRTSASGMAAQQVRTEVIANNLANVNTTGFKRSRAHFVDLLYQNVQGPATLGGPEAGTMPAVQVGRGVRLAGVQRLHTQGPLEQTGRSMDLAIEGEGFFQVQLPGGKTGYTRDGSFTVSQDGTLVTQEGYALSPSIRVPEDSTGITISRGGVVTAEFGSGSEPRELGRIELARFANPAGLMAMGDNVYTESPSAGSPVAGFPQEDGMGAVQQGALESSNVEIVQEMVDMITSMRAYELNSKGIKNAEEMSEIANNLVR